MARWECWWKWKLQEINWLSLHHLQKTESSLLQDMQLRPVTVTFQFIKNSQNLEPSTQNSGWQGCLQVGISLALIEYNTGNHCLARERTLVEDKVRQHLIKCMDYDQVKTVIFTIDFTINSYCRSNHSIINYILFYSCLSPKVK